MPSAGTKVVLAKVSGKTSTNVSHCTASTLLATSPTMADSQEKASVNSRTIPAMASPTSADSQEKASVNSGTIPEGASQSVKLAPLRKPITRPTTSITTVEMV